MRSTMYRVRAAMALIAVVSAAAVSIAGAPAELIRAHVPDLPHGVVAPGEVALEVSVDDQGTVTQVTVVRHTPPYTDLLAEAVREWSFAPSGAGQEARVMVVGVFRSPNLQNVAGLGTPPEDRQRASAKVPAPRQLVQPNHPTGARDGGVVLLGLQVDDRGRVAGVSVLRSAPGLDGAARQAAGQWRFRPAYEGDQPVARTVFAVVGFPQPVLAGPDDRRR